MGIDCLLQKVKFFGILVCWFGWLHKEEEEEEEGEEEEEEEEKEEEIKMEQV